MTRKLAGFLGVLLCVACQRVSSPTPPSVPPSIQVAPGLTVLSKAAARGAQIYTCRANATDPKIFEWTLKAPDAELFDDQGQKLGRHYAGPTWEALDGSKVVASLKAKADAPDASAVPWLLLETKSNEGSGVFSKVKSVQRVDTVGGKAPAAGCDAAHDGSEVRVDYRASYYFWG
ncbi:MAG TPA: DUF3455 domain-containing protein [Polyangiaceae bacterium]